MKANRIIRIKERNRIIGSHLVLKSVSDFITKDYYKVESEYLLEVPNSTCKNANPIVDDQIQTGIVLLEIKNWILVMGSKSCC